MAAIILVLSVFVIGAGVVVGLFMAVTKLPAFLLQRKQQCQHGRTFNLLQH